MNRNLSIEATLHEAIGKLLSKLKAEGHPVTGFKVHGGPLQEAGWPDWILCVNGRFVAIEGKRPGEKAAPLQQHRIDEINRCNGFAGVFDSIDRIEAFLDVVLTLQRLQTSTCCDEFD